MSSTSILARSAALRLLFFLLLMIPLASLVLAQDWDAVQMKTTELAPQIFMIEGAGGNLVLCTGEDGAFLVDDQFAPLNEKIRAAIAEQTDSPVQWVLNTHWHGDHTGGNEDFGSTGSFIVAHENVRQRMSHEQFSDIFDRTTPASPAIALPVVTFNDSISFYWNGQTLRVFHVAPAHTDGDALVHFVEANVLHAGDVFWSQDFPFVDHASGGSLDGMIDALALLIDLIDDDTQVVPGHGQVSDRAGIQRTREMLIGVRAAITALLDEGMDLDAIVEANPTGPWNEEWGNGWLDPEEFTRITTSGMILARAGN